MLTRFLFGLIIFRCRLVVIHQYSMSRPLQVIKLPRLDRPEKEPGNSGNQYQAKRNQQKENIHGIKGS